MTPAPHPIDTDARKLCAKLLLGLDGHGGDHCDYACDAQDVAQDYLRILDELDRLRAAEAAGKAEPITGEELLDFCRKVDTKKDRDLISFVDRLVVELRTARAEIARLTDDGAGQELALGIAAAVAVVNELWAKAEIAAGLADNAQDKALNEERLQFGDEILVALSNLVANAPPPPAAADRGALGQNWKCPKCGGLSFCHPHEQKADGSYGPGAFTRCLDCKADIPPADQTFRACKTCVGPVLWFGDMEVRSWLGCDHDEAAEELAFNLNARAALATAPKAEDVRREALKEAAHLADAGPGSNGRHIADRIRALADRPHR